MYFGLYLFRNYESLRSSSDVDVFISVQQSYEKSV